MTYRKFRKISIQLELFFYLSIVKFSFFSVELKAGKVFIILFVLLICNTIAYQSRETPLVSAQSYIFHHIPVFSVA